MEKADGGNDYLTFRAASPEDYWFHARGWPGAHVVLKTAGGKGVPPEEIVRDAAALAAWYSGARAEAMADVACTLRKHVRRVKGKAPGKVILSNERVVRVAPGRPSRFKER